MGRWEEEENQTDSTVNVCSLATSHKHTCTHTHTQKHTLQIREALFTVQGTRKAENRGEEHKSLIQLQSKDKSSILSANPRNVVYLACKVSHDRCSVSMFIYGHLGTTDNTMLGEL